MNTSLLKSNKYFLVIFSSLFLILSFFIFFNTAYSQTPPTLYIATSCNYPGYPNNPSDIKCSDCGWTFGPWSYGNPVGGSCQAVKEGVDGNGKDLCRTYCDFNAVTFSGRGGSGAACYTPPDPNQWGYARCFYSGTACTRTSTAANPYVYYNSYYQSTNSVETIENGVDRFLFPVRATNDVTASLCPWETAGPGPADFTIDSAPKTPPAIAQGQSRIYTITVYSVNGFNGIVNLSAVCPTSNPANATCNFSSSAVSVPADGSVTASYTVNTTIIIPPGTYPIPFTGTSPGFTNKTTNSDLVVSSAAAGSPPSVAIDLPCNSGINPPPAVCPSSVSGNSVSIAGWAIDNTTSIETAISNVQISIDGVFVGNATYGLVRTDVCNPAGTNPGPKPFGEYPGRVGCPNVGYNLNWNSTTVPNGIHTIRARATDSDGTPHSSFTEILVNVNNVVSPATLSVSPTSFSTGVTLGTGSTTAGTLTITNTSGAGAERLSWSVSDNASWLDVRRTPCAGCETSGVENPGQSSTPALTVTVNATGLPVGTYYATTTVTGTNFSAGGSANGSPKNIDVILTVTAACVGPTCAICDGTWRPLGPFASADGQPVGVYLPTGTNSQFADSVTAYVRGAGSGFTYFKKCKYNGLNTCDWSSEAWINISTDINPARTFISPHAESPGAWDIFLRGNNNTDYKRSNTSGGWLPWGPLGNGNTIAWGKPYRIPAKNGQIFQLRRAEFGAVQYYCNNTPICENVGNWYNSTIVNSTFSPTTVSTGGSVNITCDYGTRIDAIRVNTVPAGGLNCPPGSFNGWTHGTTQASYTCSAGPAGTYTVSCRTVNDGNVAGDFVCAQTNNLAPLLNVTPSATADIKANGSDNPPAIPYNGSADITWTSSGATACNVTPTGWTETNGAAGAHVVNNMTSAVTYTIYCDPSSAAPEDSVTVNVLPNPNKGLTVIKAGQGAVTSVPAGINCGADCNEDYLTNTTVTLTETHGATRRFTGWLGATCSGGGETQRTSTCTFDMDTDKTVTANWAVDPTFREF